MSAPFVVELLVEEIERLQLTIHGLMKALGHG
jgi:flagellar biosynthetic protein FliR